MIINFRLRRKKRQLCRLDEEKNQILFGSGDSEKDTKQLMEEKEIHGKLYRGSDL